MTTQPYVEITKTLVHQLDTKDFWGGNIDLPTINSQHHTHSFEFGGWVLPYQTENTVRLELSSQQIPLTTIEVDVPRLDVARVVPQALNAETCGFWSQVNTLSLPSEFALDIKITIKRQRIPFGIIEGRQQQFYSPYEPNIQPLMLTLLGRSGSTWLMRLLSEHPQIVAYRKHPYEIFAFNYWLQMFNILSTPGDHFHSEKPEHPPINRKWIGQHPYYHNDLIDYPEVRHWFDRNYLSQLAIFCQSSIDTFYQQVAVAQKQLAPVYFMEKCPPTMARSLAWNLYPQAREVFLVRDVRDRLCSAMAFNKKRGFADFGYQYVNSDLEYIQRQRISELQLLNSWQSRRNCAYLVRYEDLIRFPHECLTKLLNYLNLDSSPDIIARMLQTASQDTDQLQSHRTSSDIQTSIGRWKYDMDEELQAACDEYLGDILQAWGYN